MAIFKLKNDDWSANVIAGSYKINQYDIYNEWTDGYKVLHHDKIRSKIKGSFDMMFKTQADFTAFMRSMESAKDINTNAYYCSMKINNIRDNGELSSHQCFLKLEPTRNIKGAWEDYFEKFTVEVEER